MKKLLIATFCLYQLQVVGQTFPSNRIAFDTNTTSVSIIYCEKEISELRIGGVPDTISQDRFQILREDDSNLGMDNLLKKEGDTLFLQMDTLNLVNLPSKPGSPNVQYLKLKTNDGAFQIIVEYEENECEEEVIKYEFINPYYDALELILNKNDPEFSDFEIFLYSTMKAYGSDSALIHNSFLENSFRDKVELTYINSKLNENDIEKKLKDKLEKRKKELEERKVEELSLVGGFSKTDSGEGAGIISTSVSTLGGLNVTTFADELSQFLIDRAKQELNVAFFQRLSKFFDKTPEIRVLFPKTADVLENLLSYEYPTMINTLRNVFQEDLENVFFKTDDVFKLPKYEPLIKEFPEIILSLKTIQIIAEIDDERHPSDIIGDFKDIPEWTDPKLEKHFSSTLYNFRAALQTGYLFSESVRFNSFDEPRKLKELGGKKDGKVEVIVQLDSGLARAIEEETYYYITDTIKRSTQEEFKNTIASLIRKNTIDSLISDSSYLNPFLENLTRGKIAPGTISASNIEELVLKVDKYIEDDSLSFRKKNTDYAVKKMIRNFNHERAWITRQHINYLIQDTTAFKFFMAILFQKSYNQNIQTAKKTKLLSDDTNSHLLLRGSVLIKDSNIGVGSDKNGINYSGSLKKDERITSQSSIVSGSNLKAGSILFEPQSFYELLGSKKDQLYLVRDYFQELIELTDDIDQVFAEIKLLKSTNEKISDEKLHEYINKSIDVLEYVTDVSYFFQDNVQYDPYLKIARNGNDMYLNIVQKEYSAAVNNLVTILEEVSKEVNTDFASTSLIRSVNNEIQNIKNDKKATLGKSFLGIRTGPDAELNKIFNDKISIVKQKKFDIERFRKFSNTTTKILKYGTFMANLVQSDSAEEIQAAIKAAALPVGSYSIKRESRWDVSINAYLGAGYSREFISSDDLDEINNQFKKGVLDLSDPNIPSLDRESKTFGVWAPVGIAGSYGSNIGSFSLFISLIDPGAVVNFRLQNQVGDSVMISVQNAMDTVSRSISVDKLPEIRLENIFAPGAYLVYGIPSVPISLGAGIQQGPNLRRFDINENGEVFSTVKASAYRWNFFIAVDIPLVTLFNRPR